MVDFILGTNIAMNATLVKPSQFDLKYSPEKHGLNVKSNFLRFYRHLKWRELRLLDNENNNTKYETNKIIQRMKYDRSPKIPSRKKTLFSFFQITTFSVF